MRGWLKRIALILGALLLLVLLAAVGGGIWLRSELRASLPQIDGTHELPQLQRPVVVERDAAGVPSLTAENYDDMVRALGFVHASDRYFQMDLLRRSAAGELSALIGPGALPLDRRVRLHRFRSRARRNLNATDAHSAGWIESYTEGINAGLAALGASPPEYLALRVAPEPWRAEDSLLVVLAMYLDLQGGSGRRELGLRRMSQALPRPLYDFLTPCGSEWDAPLVGSPCSTPEIPGAEVYDLRSLDLAALHAPPPRWEPVHPVGSNNWAVAGTHTADGRALLANDMHLRHSMPNIWFRARLNWRDESGATQSATGATLPGLPGVIAGSSGHIAWGLTNSEGDWIDIVELEIDESDSTRYRTPQGWRAFERIEETIEIKGRPAESLTVTESIWGPVVTDTAGRPLHAVRWVAHDEEGCDLNLLGLQHARSVDQALDVAARSGMPEQNLVVADASGRIAWTISGRIPRRVGFDGRLPSSWADGERRWDGWLGADEYPRVVDPPSGRLWTANNRTVDGEWLARLGDGGLADGARAGQIRDALMLLDRATVDDLLALQLDDRALFLTRWHELLLEVLDDEAVAVSPRRGELRRFVKESWNGHASVDSVAYRAVRAFRIYLARDLFGAITAACRDDETDFNYLRLARWEGPLWRLVQERPEHLLPPAHASWRDALLSAADEIFEQLPANEPDALAQYTWGRRNTVRVQHPLSQAVPQLARWLDIPVQPLPGDSKMPRVQSISFGASERMIVSPGLEGDGLFHMPGGQSGHFLSPFYRAGHEGWAEGQRTPFLPGPAVHRLELVP